MLPQPAIWISRNKPVCHTLTENSEDLREPACVLNFTHQNLLNCQTLDPGVPVPNGQSSLRPPGPVIFLNPALKHTCPQLCKPTASC